MVGYNRNTRRDSKFFVKNSHKRFSKFHSFFSVASLDEESLKESLFLIWKLVVLNEIVFW